MDQPRRLRALDFIGGIQSNKTRIMPNASIGCHGRSFEHRPAPVGERPFHAPPLNSASSRVGAGAE